MKVLLIILTLLALLLYLPVGVDVGYDGTVQLRLRLGAVTIPLLPRKSGKKPKKEKKPKQKAASAETGKPAKTKRKYPIRKEDILDAVGVLIRSIKRLRFRVRRLKLHFVSAFDDPYDTAMAYGYVCAGVNALGLDRVRGADIQLSADFTAERWTLDAACSITIRIWYLVKFTGCILAGGIPILLRIRKRMKQTQPEFAQPAGKEA